MRSEGTENQKTQAQTEPMERTASQCKEEGDSAPWEYCQKIKEVLDLVIEKNLMMKDKLFKSGESIMRNQEVRAESAPPLFLKKLKLSS